VRRHRPSGSGAAQLGCFAELLHRLSKRSYTVIVPAGPERLREARSVLADPPERVSVAAEADELAELVGRAARRGAFGLLLVGYVDRVGLIVGQQVAQSVRRRLRLRR
jgi:hypothetical protein